MVAEGREDDLRLIWFLVVTGNALICGARHFWWPSDPSQDQVVSENNFEADDQ